MRFIYAQNAYHQTLALPYHARMSQPKQRTGKSFQIAVRLPLALYEFMRTRPKPLARQLVEAMERERELLASLAREAKELNAKHGARKGTQRRSA